MRIKTPGQPTPRPPEATAFLQREQHLDDEIRFDPQRDLQKSDVNEMLDWISRFRLDGLLESFLKLASEFVVVFPERAQELGLTDDDWTELERFCHRQRHNETEQDDYLKWREWARYASALATLFPRRRNELALGEIECHEVMTMIRIAQRSESWDDLCMMAVAWNVLFPEHRTQAILDDAVWDGLRGRLDETRGQDWTSFGRTAATLTLLFPQRRAELNIDGAAWQGMHEALKRHRRIKHWIMFGGLAWSLTILGAQDAQFTSDGCIEITPKKPLLADKPLPLPLRHR